MHSVRVPHGGRWLTIAGASALVLLAACSPAPPPRDEPSAFAPKTQPRPPRLARATTTTTGEHDAETLADVLSMRPLEARDPDLTEFGESPVQTDRTDESTTNEVAQALARRLPPDADPAALARELMSDKILNKIAPTPELRGALAMFTGTIAQPVLDGLRRGTDPLLAHVQISFNTEPMSEGDPLATRTYQCTDQPDSVALVSKKLWGSRLEAIAAVLFHELLHAPLVGTRDQWGTPRQEHIPIFWLEHLMWAQASTSDPDLFTSGDYGTSTENKGLVEFLNSSTGSDSGPQFDPKHSVGDISTWSVNTIDPSYWRAAFIREDQTKPLSKNSILPAVLAPAGVPSDDPEGHYDDALVDRMSTADDLLSPTQWLGVIAQLGLEPVGDQLTVALAGGHPAPGRSDSEWVFGQDGAQRRLVVTMTNVGRDVERGIEMSVNNSQGSPAPNAIGRPATADVALEQATAVRSDGSGTVSVPVRIGEADRTTGPVLQIGDLAPGEQVRVEVPVSQDDSGIDDGFIGVRVGSEREPLVHGPTQWDGLIANGVSLLQPWSAASDGPPLAHSDETCR
jgi:hypothetical protein